MAVFWALQALLGLLALFVGLVSVMVPLRFLGITSRGRGALTALVGAGLVIVAVVAFDLEESASTAQSTPSAPVAAAEGASPSAAKPDPMDAAAPEQRRLLDAVLAARKSYAEAENEMGRGASRPARAKAICAAITNLAVRNWVGRVETLSSNSDGKGVLSISIGSKVSIKTWNNAFSDATHHTLMDPDSPIHRQAVVLKVRQAVRFSGYFFRSASDCIVESSATLSGSIAHPEFIMRFTSLAGL